MSSMLGVRDYEAGSEPLRAIDFAGSVSLVGESRVLLSGCVRRISWELLLAVRGAVGDEVADLGDDVFDEFRDPVRRQVGGIGCRAQRVKRIRDGSVRLARC